MDIKILNSVIKDLFNALDAKDGNKDKCIQKSVWDGFANIAGGKEIRNCIFQDRAEVSIKSYLSVQIMKH